MHKTLKRVCAICMLLMLIVMPCQASADGAVIYRYIHELADYLCDYAKFPAEKSTLIDAAFKSNLVNPDGGFDGMITEMMNCLDEHSSYIPPEELEYFMDHTISGNFTGIGVMISVLSHGTVVMSTIANSPAEKAGILPGDILFSIDGESVYDMGLEALQEKIRGEAGTSVTVTVMRGEEEKSFTMERAFVEDPIVSYHIEENIGYLAIDTFSMATISKVEEALASFRAANVENVILDLRNNPGGVLDAALDICRMFTPSGVIMRVEYANAEQNQLFYNETGAKDNFRLAVLVNGGSASASELVAGAIMDTGSGVIIGEKTFGKGTMQTIRSIITGGAIRLTVAEYKTAGGRSVHHNGLTPDIVVQNTYEVPDVSYMQELIFNTVWQEGDTGEGVLAVEERLSFLGYLEEADIVFSEDTTAALRLYQAVNDLPVTGIADIYTQIELHNADYETPILKDNQLKAAKEYFHATR